MGFTSTLKYLYDVAVFVFVFVFVCFCFCFFLLSIPSYKLFIPFIAVDRILRSTKKDKRPISEPKCVNATTAGTAQCKENDFDKCDAAIMNINRKAESGPHLRECKTDGNEQLPQNQTGNKLIKDENGQNSGKYLNPDKRHDSTDSMNIRKDENQGADCGQQKAVDKEVKEDTSMSRTKLHTR